MKKDYADKSWIHADLDAHWHEQEVNAYVKIVRLTLIPSVLAAMTVLSLSTKGDDKNCPIVRMENLNPPLGVK